MNWLRFARMLVAMAILVFAIAVGIWMNDWRWGVAALGLGLIAALGLGRTGF